MKSRIFAVAGFLALSLIWGSSWLTNGMVAAPPLRLQAMRLTVGAVMVSVLAALVRSRLPSPAALRANSLLGIMLIAIPFGLLTWTNQRSVVVLPMVLFGGVPLVTALLETRMTTTPIPWRAIQATLVGAGGVALLLSNGLSISASEIWGILVILGAIGSHAFSLVLTKAWLRDEPLLISVATQMGTAAATLWLLSEVFEKPDSTDWTRQAWIATLILGLIGSGAGYLLYLWLLREMKPREIATMFWMVPVVAIGEGSAAARQLPPWSILAAAAIIVGSLVVLFRARLELEEAVTLKVTVPQFDEHGQNLR